jgi:hypothetical protein
MGAVSYQCTYLGPAVGTRDFEPAARQGIMFKSVGGRPVPQACQDGNHVAASRHAKPWERQINVLRAYARFYNPVNTVRILSRMYRDPLAGKRLLFQAIGQIGLLMTIPKLLNWAWKLRRGPISTWDGLQRARIPMLDSSSGKEVDWAVQRVASASIPSAGIVRRPAIRLSMPRAQVERRKAGAQTAPPVS